MNNHFKEGFMKCAEEQKYPPPLKQHLKNTVPVAKILGGRAALLGGLFGIVEGATDLTAARMRLSSRRLTPIRSLKDVGTLSAKKALIGAGLGTGLTALLSAHGYAKMYLDKNKYDK
jgi:hypothetical protein